MVNSLLFFFLPYFYIKSLFMGPKSLYSSFLPCSDVFPPSRKPRIFLSKFFEQSRNTINSIYSLTAKVNTPLLPLEAIGKHIIFNIFISIVICSFSKMVSVNNLCLNQIILRTYYEIFAKDTKELEI